MIWLVASVGRFLTWMLSMALSRSREYMADAQAVRMTKNPLALAEALRKIAGKFRGGGDPPTGFQSSFILHPEAPGLDEGDGFFADLFSTHPPVGRRIQKLLDWAKADLASPKESAARAGRTPPRRAPGTRYHAFLKDQWMGPYTLPQFLASASLEPRTWVCAEGATGVVKAGEVPELSLLFTKALRGSRSGELCPACHVPLLRKTYEGARTLTCAFCEGSLLEPGVLERIVARREEIFGPEQVEAALAWRKAQVDRPLGQTPSGLVIACPTCGKAMSKSFHLMLTRVVIDRCPHDGKVWLEKGELDLVQILVEQSAKIEGKA